MAEPHNPDQVCANCVYWSKAIAGDKPDTRAPSDTGAFGTCRRHAPTGSGFHRTYAGEWCGDFADEWGTIINRRALRFGDQELEELVRALRRFPAARHELEDDPDATLELGPACEHEWERDVHGPSDREVEYCTRCGHTREVT